MPVQNDAIFEQTLVERDVQDRRRSTARRLSFFVDEATDAGAIQQALTDLPSFIDAFGVAVPLLKIIPRRLTGTKVWINAIYAFGSTGGPEADDPFAFANVRIRSMAQEWWSDSTEWTLEDGYEGRYPSGPVYAPMDWLLLRRVEQPWTWMVTIWEIEIRVVLDSGIIGALAGLHDTLNLNAFIIADKTFPPRTLWFSGPDQSSTLIAGTTGLHDVRYRFLYRGDGWFRQVPEGLEDPEREEMYRPVEWTAASFPTS